MIKNFIFDKLRIVNRAAPAIFTTGAVIGFIATVILSNKTSLKMKDVIEDKQMENKEKFDILTKEYAPSILAGIFTTSCIVTAFSISKKREASLIGLSLIGNKFVKDYYETIKNELNVKDGKEFITKTLLDLYPKREEIKIENVVKEESNDENCEMFFDPYYGHIFQCDKIRFDNALYELNKKLAYDGHVRLIDFYNFLKIPLLKTKEVLGLKELGWSYDQGFVDGYVWINLDIKKVDIGDGTQCNHIIYETEPANLYL